MRVVVAGAGVAGLAASLVLARAGHDVVLVDRDGAPDDATREPWEARPGCAQLNQAHAFLSRGRNLMVEHTPDVSEQLLALGANETDGNRILPPEHHDPALRALAVRRPLIDQALTRAVRSEQRIEFRQMTVTGIELGPSHDGIPTVAGIRGREGELLAADLVVDALGRRTVFPDLLAAAGTELPAEERHETGILYYSRPYELLADQDPKAMFGPVAVRGSVGFLAFAVFRQDGRVMTPLLNISPADRELRALKDETAFSVALSSVPELAHLEDPTVATPIGPVTSMGGLQNTYRSFRRNGAPVAHGYVPIGDARCHTDPSLALGMSMGLHQAFLLPELLESADGDAPAALEEAVDDELRARFRHAVRLCGERSERLAGRPADVNVDRELVIETGLMMLGRNDPELLRRLLRRMLALDPTDLIPDDEALVAAARDAVEGSGILQKPPPVTRDELLARIAAAG